MRLEKSYEQGRLNAEPSNVRVTIAVFFVFYMRTFGRCLYGLPPNVTWPN